MVIVSRCAWTLYNFRRNLIVRLTERGDRVVALGSALDGFGARLTGDGVDFRHIPVPMRGLAPLGDLLLTFRLWATLRRERPAVVHLFTIKPVIYGALAAAAAGVPRRICTITGLGHAFTDGGRAMRTIAETLYRIALAQAHVVFFQNEEDRQLFVSRRLVDARKTALVPGSGVDLAHFAPAPSQGGAMRFLMVARLLREKGVMEFVAAAERLRAEGCEAEFRLLGAQDTRNPSGLSASEMARLQASPVEWVGAVDDVRPEVADADVVVLPSYREGAPRVLLEAMAMAKPIVTTDAPGCRQMIDQGANGFLVRPRDPDDLADALRRCLESRASLATMGQAGRAYVERAYSEEVVLDRFLHAYAEAA